MDDAQRERASRFLALHRGPGILLLCNVWDAASARVVEDAGFPAVATTSAGVANSLGYADEENAPFEKVVAAVRSIVRAVRVPVSADIEAGFGETPRIVAESCLAILDAGAVGVNLEDRARESGRLIETELQCEKIRAIQAAVSRIGGRLVVNARTDVYLGSIGEPEGRFDETVKRCNAYRAAGADCLFAPGVADEETIAKLVGAITGPVNILAAPGMPPISRLASLGVRRVSLGSGPMRATLARLRRIARELLESGTYSTMTSDTISYADVNELFTRDGR